MSCWMEYRKQISPTIQKWYVFRSRSTQRPQDNFYFYWKKGRATWKAYHCPPNSNGKALNFCWHRHIDRSKTIYAAWTNVYKVERQLTYTNDLKRNAKYFPQINALIIFYLPYVQKSWYNITTCISYILYNLLCVPFILISTMNI
jgi:hypothetical protein